MPHRFSAALAYSAFLPQGGLAPLSSEAKEVAKLKTVGNLNITATALTLPLSLTC